MPSDHLSRLTVAAIACAFVLPIAACDTQQEEFIETPEAQEQIPIDTVAPGAQPAPAPAPAPAPQPSTEPGMELDTGTEMDADTGADPDLDSSMQPRP